MAEEIDTVVELYRQGELDRRGTIKRLLSAGLSAPAAYVAIGAMAVSSAAMGQAPPAPMPDYDDILLRNFGALTKLISSPEMLAAMDVAEREPDKRKAAEILINAAYAPGLRQRLGLSSDDLRTSMRVFERNESSNAETILASTRRIGLAGPVTHSSGGESAPITDARVQQYFESEAVKPKVASGATQREGVCVSYGKDLCMSAGVP